MLLLLWKDAETSEPLVGRRSESRILDCKRFSFMLRLDVQRFISYWAVVRLLRFVNDNMLFRLIV